MIEDGLNNWHFDPVAGEYRPALESTFDGTGEVSAADLFAGRTMLVLGVTGFVGKVLLAMMLDRFPEIRHLYVQIRPRKNAPGAERFRKDILGSPPLAGVVRRTGVESILAKTTVVEGDLGQPVSLPNSSRKCRGGSIWSSIPPDSSTSRRLWTNR